MNDILIIGACENKFDPTNTGGVVVLFENFKYELENIGINYYLVDTNKSNYPNIVLAMSSIFYNIFILGKKSKHISLHGTVKDYIFIAPFVLIVSKLFGIKYSLRKFAGNFDEYYMKSSFITKEVIKFVLRRSNANFFETKYLVKFFRKYNNNTFWFPNVRKVNSIKIRQSTYLKRFIFCSQVYKTKGIDEILNVSNKLPNDYIINLYGPLKDLKYTDKYFANFKANYRGQLMPSEVQNILSEYDVLLLPTYYDGEGYPGIIIEAYSLGLPVITTDWKSISEIATNDTGVIIKIKDEKSLEDAILSFNMDIYKIKSLNAYKASKQFDSAYQTKLFLELFNS